MNKSTQEANFLKTELINAVMETYFDNKDVPFRRVKGHADNCVHKDL